MSQWIKYTGFPKNYFHFNIYVWALIIIWLLTPLLYIVLSKLIYIRNVYNRRKYQEISPAIDEVTIIVLGDLGHSPRMTYHAQSFLKLGYQVNICGYLESELPKTLYNPNISIYEIPVIKNTMKLPYLIFAASKIFSQIFNLAALLKDVLGDRTRYVLIQNPPSLPLLFIVVLLRIFWVPNGRLIIDWHNLNYSILNLKYKNDNHPVVKSMKFYEKYFSKKYADLNLTVTESMKQYLIQDFGISSSRIITLYDRPSEVFKPLNSREELKNIIDNHKSFFENTNYDQTKDRIIITSTSFTEDEDFSILVDALHKLDIKLESENTKSNILMIVTGKGPLEKQFLDQVKSHNWEHVFIKNVWLPIEQYPIILKIADLGISLHYSSSGLDLPMKIVDLFGSGVPVITLGFPVISELVKDRINGLIIKENHNCIEMSDKIYNVLFQDKKLYIKLKEGALLESKRHWDDEWNLKLSRRFALTSNNL